jgi:recombination protein RecA
MATKKRTTEPSQDETGSLSDIEDISKQLIIDLNKEFGTRVAFNLSDATAPTVIKRWIPTGSKLLDYAISNRKNGGVPEGRIIELSGLPSTGKSHIAYEMCKNVQRQGGLVVYVDTENATSIDKLHEMGIDVSKRFVFCDTHCTEEAFKIIESTITKARSLMDKNIPMLVVWDSIAGSSPKEELDGDFDKNTVGLQARILSKGMRKITGLIGQSSATLLCLNQLRSKISAGYGGDPYVTPGGAAIPYYSSVRIRLTGEGTRLKDSAGNVVGIKVPLRIIKNKVAPPHRTLDLEIRFGVGISEEESLLTELLSWCSKRGAVVVGDNKATIEGSGKAWKTLLVTDAQDNQVLSKKFTKNEFTSLMKDPTCKDYVDAIIDAALTVKFGDPEPENDDYNPKSEFEPLDEDVSLSS